MIVRSAILVFHIPYANSLKDKRQVSRSLIDQARKRFNVSIAEVDTNDVHRTLTIGIAVVSGDADHALRSLNAVADFLEQHADAELQAVDFDAGY